MIELNKIYNEDCLEGMKRIPRKCGLRDMRFAVWYNCKQMGCSYTI